MGNQQTGGEENTQQNFDNASNSTIIGNQTNVHHPPPEKKDGPSTVIMVAIITGVFAVIAAAVGVLPDLIDRMQPTPDLTATHAIAQTALAVMVPSETATSTQTSTDTATPTPTKTETPTVTWTASSTPSQTPSPTVPPSLTPESLMVTSLPALTVTSLAVTTVEVSDFPCEGTIVLTATTLQVVRRTPEPGAPLTSPVQGGQQVTLFEKRGDNPASTWYRITPDNQILPGWIPAQYVAPSSSCPN